MKPRVLDYKAIGLRIKFARLRKEYTQDKMAELTGLSNVHISNIENANTTVGLATLVKIANALETTVDVFLCDHLDQSKPIYEGEIIDVTSDCNLTETRIIADTVKALKETLRYRLKLESNEAL